MAIFKQRLPGWAELLPVIGVIAFPIYTWSILVYFWHVPSLVLNLRLTDVMVVLAYLLSFALLETFGITSILLILSFILPLRWLRHQFIPMGTAIALMFTCWALLMQWSIKFRSWKPGILLLWHLAFLLLCIMVYRLIIRRPKLKAQLASLADRLLVLVYFYLPLSLVSLAVVTIRLIG